MLTYTNFRSRNISSMSKKNQQQQQSPPTNINPTNLRPRYLNSSSCSFRQSSTRSSSHLPAQSSIYRSALVYNNHAQQIFHDFNGDHKRQIASLTKIMTCYTALQFIRNYDLVPECIQCEISKQAINVKGTTANLEEGYVVSLWDLLHGLMLPSGNDAAVCIAQNIGKMMKQKIQKQKQKQRSNIQSKIICISPRGKFKRKQFIRKNHPTQFSNDYIPIFIKQMNKNARILQMSSTKYNNPHGLPDIENYSTAKDQLLLIKQCIKNKLFQRIINTKLYFGTIRQKSEIWTQQIIWENTNRLLTKGYRGVKTGNTLSAGYCLASWYNRDGDDVIVIVLGCGSKEDRDYHTMRLTKQNINKNLGNNNNINNRENN